MFNTIHTTRTVPTYLQPYDTRVERCFESILLVSSLQQTPEMRSFHPCPPHHGPRRALTECVRNRVRSTPDEACAYTSQVATCQICVSTDSIALVVSYSQDACLGVSGLLANPTDHRAVRRVPSPQTSPLPKTRTLQCGHDVVTIS